MTRQMIRPWLHGLAALLCLLDAAMAPAAPPSGWVTSWASAQQIPEERNALAPEDLRDATLRQIVRVSIGGERIRIRLSNVFGTAPLRIADVRVARSADPASARIDPGTSRIVTFGSRGEITIPAGADYTSDPIDVAVPAMTHLAVSLYLPEAPARQTSHPGSRATSYLVHGNETDAADLPGARTVVHWYQLSGIDVAAEPGAAIVTLGDSITDGYGVEANSDKRWPDFLARRLQADPATRHLAVVNQGIGGNRMLLDDLGPNALARFDRDVLGQQGVRYLILLEGVNDLGTLTRDAPASPEAHKALVGNVIAAYRQMVTRARGHGIRAIGATILPYGASEYYHPGPESEADRQAINAWIRAPGNFDAVIDFDALMRDPADPKRMRKALDSGDGLHPSIAGYEAMADAVPLALFKDDPAANGPEIAITFDDLPVHGSMPVGGTRLGIIHDITSALRNAGVGEAYAFINGASIKGQADHEQALEAWTAAGYPLGNHGWSHANLNAVTIDTYNREIALNEPILKRKMGPRDWHWYRYPYLAEGDDPAKRKAVRSYLAAHEYRIAQVTMSFADYDWTEPYARCSAKKEEAAVAGMETAYLAAARENLIRSRAIAHALYGRDIPYVLLMHVGAFTARMLPRLLDLYRAEGVRFVTLDRAERDPAYATDVDPDLAPEPAGLEARLGAVHGSLPRRNDPGAMLNRLCR